jgi:hypothetical protein
MSAGGGQDFDCSHAAAAANRGFFLLAALRKR